MNYTDKIGQIVLNKKGEKGTIVKVDNEHICVEFSDRTPVFQIDAFEKGFLTFLNPIFQNEINEGIKQAKIKTEENKRIHDELIKKQIAEQSKAVKQAPTMLGKKKNLKIDDMFGKDYHVEHLKRQPILAYQEAEKQFGINISGFGRGINPTDNSVVLISNISKKGKSFVYHDRWTIEGDYIYSGEGRLGDQKMTKGNLQIVTAKERGKKIFLFVKFDSTAYYFQGEMELVDYYTEDEKDSEGNLRKEYKFKLRKK